MPRDTKTSKKLAAEPSHTLTLFAADSLVRTSQVRELGAGSPANDPDSGSSTGEFSKSSDPDSPSSRTSHPAKSSGSRKSKRTSRHSDTLPAPSRFLPPTLEPRTFVDASSLLPTLTAKANLLAPSMQKWAAHRRLLPTLTSSSYGTNQGGAAGRTGEVRPSLNTLAGGPLNPQWCEWFMGFPANWTDVEDERSETPSSPNVPKSSAA